MKAGIELDALIAQNIMGGQRHYYSSDISAALLVLNKVTDSGYAVNICRPWDETSERYWSVFFIDADTRGVSLADRTKKANTLEHAICLAALATLENE